MNNTEEGATGATAWLKFGYEGFRLADELGRLKIVHDGRAIEATVFYCARILEALTASGLARLGGRPRPSVFANLQELVALNVVPRALEYWGHALRRLGNEARHITRPLAPGEDSVALALADRWLRWFFSIPLFGAGVEADFRTLDQLLDADATELSRRLSALELGATEPALGARGSDDVAGMPVLASLGAELLIGAGALNRAAHVVEAARVRFPDDLRLAQLDALGRSRAGDIDGAIGLLESLRRRRPDDPETAGILAGAYKRRWQQNVNRGDGGRALRLYRDGWRRGGEADPYLGINTAAMSLLLGEPLLAAETSQKVEALLNERADRLAAMPSGGELGFWDRLALAEANLLLGRDRESDALYARVAEAHPERIGDLQVARDQADRIRAARDGGT